jgi:5-dehydro-4-deoxyglucarate dehydratase
MSLAQKFIGVFGFPVTPFKKDLSIDLDGMARNVDEMAKEPFCAIVATGGTGEMYSMTADECVDVARTAVEATAGRMPVVAGVGYNAPVGVAMAKGMEKVGASALLIMPPYYTNAPFEGLLEYYSAIAAATGLEVSLYSRDWAAFTPDQVARLAERIPNLTFWKDGQGDARKYQRIMAKVGNRLAWVGGIGDDCVPAYFAVGVQAFTSSISVVAPRLSLELFAAAATRNNELLTDLMAKYVHPLYAIRDRKKGYEVAVMKRFMEMMGKPAGPVRPPLVATCAADEADIRKLVELYQADWT